MGRSPCGNNGDTESLQQWLESVYVSYTIQVVILPWPPFSHQPPMVHMHSHAVPTSHVTSYICMHDQEAMRSNSKLQLYSEVSTVFLHILDFLLLSSLAVLTAA